MKKATIRLNGSSYIYDMDLNDRYQVIQDSLWISLLSLVGNPDAGEVVLETRESPYVHMDVEKLLIDSLEDKPADFLVVDMCYTARTPLLCWNGQIYTKNPKMAESEFYAQHQSEMEEIDIMRDREFEWKPYMDRYIDLISKYFDRDHIILVKSRCPKWYVTHTHVRPMKKKGRAAYNKRIKELEDYFIKKTDPYVVDIYSHYYADYNHKKGFTMSSYEKPFYHHARRIISTIIRTQPEKRVFRGQEYYMRLGRFIKYYDHLFIKNNTGLMMDDSRFLDHLVLQLSRSVLCQYEIDFVEIEKRGYGSIEEILSNYNFKFAASLKECLKVVQAVEEGDLFRPDVHYELIFDEQLKLVGPFTELVKKEIEKRNWISGEIYVNRFNCQDYYFMLKAERDRQLAAAKKYVCSIGKQAWERQELKKMVKEGKKAFRTDRMAGYVSVMNEFYKPVSVDLWGSCITREILNEDDGRFRIEKYAYRNSFLFAFDAPIPYDDKKFEDLSLFENSSWRVGYIKDAFHKGLPEQLMETKSEWLLVDFYDLICDVVKYRGGVFTADSEVRALGFYKEIRQECEVASIEDILDDAQIQERLDRFIRFITERYGKNIIFIRADVKLKFLNFRRNLKPMRNIKREQLLKKKKFLNRWQDYFEKQADCYVVHYAKQYHADDLCVSGAFMVHYEKEFYEKGYRAIREIIYEQKGKKCYGKS